MPPLPEIWQVQGRRVLRVDSLGTRHEGELEELSPCRAKLAGALWSVVRRGDRLALGRRDTCDPAALTDAAALRVADMTEAVARVRAVGRAHLVPYGLWFGLKRQAVEKRFASLQIGASTCRREVTFGDRGGVGVDSTKHPDVPLWDIPALPHLGLPVANARCIYNRHDQLDRIELTLRKFDAFYGGGDGEATFKAVRTLVTALTRVAPTAKGKPTSRTLTWQARGVAIRAHKKSWRYEYPQGSFHGKAIIRLTFIASRGARRFPQPRWWRALAPAQTAKAKPRARKQWPPFGLRLGMRRATVLARLRAQGLEPTPMAPPDPNRRHPFEAPACPAGKPCRSDAFRGGRLLGTTLQGGRVDFVDGRLVGISLTYPSFLAQWPMLLLYQRLVRRLTPYVATHREVTPHLPKIKNDVDASFAYIHAWASRPPLDGIRVSLRTYGRNIGPAEMSVPQLYMDRLPRPKGPPARARAPRPKRPVSPTARRPARRPPRTPSPAR
jgi:hypothetical protein